MDDKKQVIPGTHLKWREVTRGEKDEAPPGEDETGRRGLSRSGGLEQAVP
jgi:hypothetical protein